MTTRFFRLVGVQGFEPWTPCSQSRCATGLRHTPRTLLYLSLRPPCHFVVNNAKQVGNPPRKTGFALSRIFSL